MLQKTCTVDYFLDPLILNFLYMCLEARLLDYTVILFLALRFIFFFLHAGDQATACVPGELSGTQAVFSIMNSLLYISINSGQ